MTLARWARAVTVARLADAAYLVAVSANLGNVVRALVLHEWYALILPTAMVAVLVSMRQVSVAIVGWLGTMAQKAAIDAAVAELARASLQQTLAHGGHIEVRH